MSNCTGTSACYSRGCRNPRCVAAEKARRLKRFRNGEPPYRDAATSRSRYTQLRNAGMSMRQIQLASGVDYATLRGLRDGTSTRVLDRTERALSPGIARDHRKNGRRALPNAERVAS